MHLSKRSCAALAGAVAVLIAAPVLAQSPTAASYTDAQAQRGQGFYDAACASCHGAALEGGAGVPALSGPDFAFGWKGKATGELFTFISTNMPPGRAGSLPDQAYADIVALIMKTNGAKAGPTELKPDAAGAGTIELGN